MYEAADIEYAGLAPGGVAIVLRGGYSDADAGKRVRSTVEFDLAAARKLRDKLTELLKGETK